jgi:hypothetical protein
MCLVPQQADVKWGTGRVNTVKHEICYKQHAVKQKAQWLEKGEAQKTAGQQESK